MDRTKEYLDFLVCPFCHTQTIYYDTWQIENPYEEQDLDILEYGAQIYCSKCGIQKIMMSTNSEKEVISSIINFWERGMI